MCAQKHFASLSNQRMCCPFSGPTLWLAQHQPFHESKIGRKKKMSSENLVRQSQVERMYVIRLLWCKYKFRVVMKITVLKITAKCNLQIKQKCFHRIRNWTVTLRDFPTICCAIEGKKSLRKTEQTWKFHILDNKMVSSDWSDMLLYIALVYVHDESQLWYPVQQQFDGVKIKSIVKKETWLQWMSFWSWLYEEVGNHILF